MDVASSEFYTSDGMYDLDFKVCWVVTVLLYVCCFAYVTWYLYPGHGERGGGGYS